MSFYEDFLADHLWQMEEEEYAKFDMYARQGVWEDKEGKMWKVKEMETSHIENCIRYIKKRNWEPAMSCIPMFEEELERRQLNETVDM